jgi:hypothetical protein
MSSKSKVETISALRLATQLVTAPPYLATRIAPIGAALLLY